jgi:hypothetical protein
LGRGELEGFGRGFDHYLECFARLLEVDYPMIIFIPKELNDFVNEHRAGKKTHIVNKELSDLEKFPFYDKVQEIRQKEEWIHRAGWIENSPQAKLPLYNPLVMSKQFFMNDAAIMNVFNTKYFMWIDGGISNTIGDPKGYFDEDFGEKISTIFCDNKMHYLCFPYNPETEVHGFEKDAFYNYAGTKTRHVARGGIFGGSKDAIHVINEAYYAMLSETMNSGYMGTEESIFTLLTYKHPHLCTEHAIESDGLVFRFLEWVKNIKKEEYNALLAVYVLTYNLPKQFEMWAEKFDKNLENIIKKDVVKFVINNSTDPDVEEEYKKLFEQYGFQELKYDNIGICGGRQIAAEHFAENNYKYMIFFEDDMLLCGEEDIGKTCKNGFKKYFKDLISRSIAIMESEDLDYFKLCFSEFYGDNNDNWAWYNVPQERKEEWFLTNKLTSDPKKVRIYYTNSFREIPYAIGEYHYCNWPLLFNQRGNKKIFLDTKFEHKYEQTWMSFVMELIVEGKIRAGCLLGSAITHFRKYHYSKEYRRENEHYTN